MNRRDALALLASLPTVSAISRASLAPTDVIVVECDQVLSTAAAKTIKDTLAEVWPTHRILVFCAGVRMRIVPATEV